MSSSDEELQQHIFEVGALCSQWAYLEYLLELTLWWMLGLLNHQAEGRVITGQWAIETMARKICDLAHLKVSDTDKVVFESTRDRINAIINERNLAVHGVRRMDPETNAIAAEIARGPLKNKIHPISTIRLASLNTEVGLIVKALQPLLARLGVIEDAPQL